MKVLLMFQHINVNQKKNKGVTPLYFTVSNGSIAYVKELLAHKNIQVNIKNEKGNTPIDTTTNRELVKLLLQKGATWKHPLPSY